MLNIPTLRGKFFRNAFIFILIFIPLFFMVYGGEFLMERLSAKGAGSPLKMKMEWWMSGFKILYEKYSGIGMGIGGFKYYHHPWKVPHSHNIYLSILFDFGMIGLTLFISFIIYLAKIFWNTVRQFQPTYIQLMVWGCGAGCIAIGSHGLIDGEYNIVIIWFILGLTLATLRMAREELKSFQVVEKNDLTGERLAT